MKTGGSISAATLRRRLLSSTHGSMTIPGLVFFTVAMAMGGLAIDMQRLYGVHGQMQSYVDNVALAAAAELDGNVGAVTRAMRAACGTVCGQTTGPLVTGSQQFAVGPATLRVQKLTFLSQLDTDPGPLGVTPTPAEVSNGWVLCTYDGGTWTPGNCNNDVGVSRNADFVEVVAEPRVVSYIILPVADALSELAGMVPASTQVRVRATAGYKVAVCDLSPLMICNPTEPSTNTNQNYPFTATVGQQIIVRAGGGGDPNQGGGAWAPGDFGWLDVQLDASVTDCLQNGVGNQEHDTGCVLGLVDPLTQCFDDNRVVVNSGQSTPTAEGLNVRFDIYPNNDKLGPMSSVSQDARFAPSVNVTKGICQFNNSDDACDYQGQAACPNPNGAAFQETTALPDSDLHTVKMPRDQTWDPTGRFGTGDWDRLSYWQQNHGWTGGTPPAVAQNWTRYQTYRNEIECSLGTAACVSTGAPNDGIPNLSSTGGEIATRIGTPIANSGSCSNQAGVNNSARDRRMLYVAVVNCNAWGLNGSSSNKLNVTAVSYLKMFMTEPVGFDNAGTWRGIGAEKNLYAEVIDTIDPHDETNIVRVYPVLYR